MNARSERSLYPPVLYPFAIAIDQFFEKNISKKDSRLQNTFLSFSTKNEQKKTRQAGFTTANHRFRPQNTVKNPMPAICARQEPLRGPAALGAEGLHPGGAQAELQ